MALFDEEPVRVKKPDTLDLLSLDELAQRIEELKAMIAACEAEIARKQAQKAAADALFGGKD